MNSRRCGLLAIMIAAGVLWMLPSVSVGKNSGLTKTANALRQATAGVGDAVQGTVDNTLSKTDEALRKAREKAAALLAKKQAAGTDSRATRGTDPKTQPPTHGTDPHGQGGVAVVDVDPKSDRPLSSDPTGKDSGEDVIVGRARGEQVNGALPDGSHHDRLAVRFRARGHQQLPGGEERPAPETCKPSVLDPLCTSTNQQVCLSVLTANSATTATGSTNDFAVARASLLGLGVGAAESHGSISEDANCQTATGTSKTANVTAGAGAVASVANAATTSKSCPRPGDADHEHLVGDRPRRRAGADPGRRLREQAARHAQRHPRGAADRLQRR